MSDIGAIGRSKQADLPASIGIPVKKQDAKTGAEDKVTLGGVMRKAGKYALGTGFAVVAAPLNAVDRGIGGSIEGGLKALDIDGPQEGIGINLERLAVLGGAVVGAISGASMGPIGFVTGAMMGPGVVGGLIAGGKGAIKGGKTGFKVTGAVARKVDEKVASKAGKLPGKAAKIATAVALGTVAIPGFALAGLLSKSFGFARKAMGVNPEPKTAGQAMGNLAKEGAMIYGYVTGAIGASPGLVSSIAGGVTTAGGIATGIAGVKSGAKGFVDGIKGSYDLAGRIMGGDKE
ncbi:MAG: hypothetical protein K8T10_06915 [Candidatus Eremiobacteraeota bacterium]|nr:hypothetical protein [Candidatus Eremiobacteraeota bacterium]